MALVFRDSFGDALLPYLAAKTQSATFTKLIPYNATLIAGQNIDYVIVERAERHLAYLSESAPAAPSPTLRLFADGLTMHEARDDETTLLIGENGPFVSFSGKVNSDLYTPESTILLSLRVSGEEELFFEPYTLSLPEEQTDAGFLAYIPQEGLPRGTCVVSVLIRTADQLTVLQSVEYAAE
jgi:hypothetical protein